MDKNKKYYLAGPMSGVPQFNFPLFESVSEKLRERGYNIISPHELDSDQVKKAALKSVDGKLINGKVAGESWGKVLARDIQVVADEVHGVVFLPGWHGSRGARLEALCAILCNHEFHFWNPDKDGTEPMDTGAVKYWIV
jgi:hypothetical protein